MNAIDKGETVADRLAKACQRHGVAITFGQSIPSAFHLSATKLGIRQIAYRTENAGGCMADGFARISNQVSIVTAQNGPAAALLVAPLAEALKVSIPVVAIVQDVTTTMVERNAFQELDHIALFSSCAKWVRRVDVANRIDDFVDMAFAAASSGRMGPAVLIIPADVLDMPVTKPSTRKATFGNFPLDRFAPDPAVLEDVADLLADAENPLIVAGGGVHLSGAVAELEALSDLASIPVATTTMGKGAVLETGPLAIGPIGQSMGHRASTRHMRAMIDKADVVLFVGSRTNQNGTDSYRLFPRGARYIQIDVDGQEIGRNYDAIRVIGDAKLALSGLINALKGRDLTKRKGQRDRVAGEIEEGRRQHREDARGYIDSDQAPLRPERVMGELDKILPDHAVVVADASYSSIWTTNYLVARHSGQRFLAPRGLAGLGWGFPMAIGAKAAEPGSTVVCVTGDGGFAHCWSEVETSVRENLPVVVIVLNNSILGFQKHFEMVRFSAFTSAVDIGEVDHAGIARACGANGVTVRTPAEIGPALAAAIASDRTAVIDVMTDPEAYPPLTYFDSLAK